MYYFLVVFIILSKKSNYIEEGNCVRDWKMNNFGLLIDSPYIYLV